MDKISVIDLYNAVNDGRIKSDIELQRAIVYDADKQAMVIDSLYHGIPLPAIYLWKNADGSFEVLDGKQRIEAIKKFLQNDLTYDGYIWREWGQHNPTFQQFIKDVELTVIECCGDDNLKRQIFNRINTLGVPLSKYEVLNGLFHGLYLEELTDHYTQDPIYKKVLKEESVDRGNNKYVLIQYILYTRLGRKPTPKEIDDYLSDMKDVSIAADIKVIKPLFKFITDIFGGSSPVKRDFLLRLAYENRDKRAIWLQHKDSIQKNLKTYIKSDDYKKSPTKYKDIVDLINAQVGGVILDPRRLFSEVQKQQLLDRLTPDEKGMYECAECHQRFYAEEMSVDHITPWSLGGRTELSNGRLTCRPCNIRLSNKIKQFLPTDNNTMILPSRTHRSAIVQRTNLYDGCAMEVCYLEDFMRNRCVKQVESALEEGKTAVKVMDYVRSTMNGG